MFKTIATSGFLTALECTKFVFGPAFAPDPSGGAYSAPPGPLAGLRGPTSKGKGRRAERERKKGREREREGPAPFRKFLDSCCGRYEYPKNTRTASTGILCTDISRHYHAYSYSWKPFSGAFGPCATSEGLYHRTRDQIVRVRGV